MPLRNPTPAPTIQDDALQRARRGSHAAFAELVREHESRIYSIALRITGHRADAEELTQDAFVQVHGALDRVADRGHLQRWLLRAITHLCLNRLRNERRRPQLVPIETLPTGSEPPASATEPDPLLSTRLRQLLLQLPTDARAVMLLRYQEDLDPSEIAVVLEMPVNTVKSHLRRSIDWMRAQCTGEDHGI